MGQKNDSHLQKMLLFAPQLPPDLIRITDNHIQADNRLQKINPLFVNIGFDVISQIMAWKVQKPELKYDILGLFKRNNTC